MLLLLSFLLCYPTTATIGAVVVATSTAFPCARFTPPPTARKSGAIDNESIKENQKVSFAKPIEDIDIKLIDPNDPANDLLEDMLDVIPTHRSSIDDSHLPVPHQEILFGNDTSCCEEENHK